MNRFFKSLENFVEQGLWLVRFMTIIPVIFGTVSALILFILGTIEILNGLEAILHPTESMHEMLPKIVASVISGIDVYLIGIVMILFSYGIYELFISKIDVGRQEGTEVDLLIITSLDQLKDKILKVIVMVMVVGLFKQSLELKIETATDMLFLAISILLVAGSVYLMNPPGSKKQY